MIATQSENLQTALDNMAERLAEVTANPKPTYSVDGQSVSWESYCSMLISNMEALRKQLQAAAGPFSVSHRGVV